MSALRARATAWLAGDPDPGTRAALEALLAAAAAGDAGAAEELVACAGADLRFGTAGLRGPMGPGPNRMNRAVVIRATAGLAAYLTARLTPEPEPELTGGQPRPLVVIGHDARRGSAEFAADVAAVLTGAGLRAGALPGLLPTPVLAFAVRRLGAAAGVMITASHNPAADNGYKVYLDDGAQLAPPADAAIEALIAAAPRAADVPRGPAADALDAGILTDYLDRAASLLAPGGARALSIVYTPLHGVAGATLREAFRRGGFEAPIEVAEQAAPDPDFPTVAFPNPEEPGALDLAAARALAVGADLVLANDPDGDRCAVMAPVLGGPGEILGYRALTGDEVGVLLAEHLLSCGRLGERGVLATTIVSSPQLAQVAAAHGHECVVTLTGFKWLGRTPGLGYAYEEALGYCVDPAAVRDKDGVTAALLVAEMAATHRAHGMRLSDRLDTLARRDGVHVTAARSIPVPDPAAACAALAALLAEPPAELAGHRVDEVADLLLGSRGVPPTEGVRLQAGPVRAIVRPSGTEPKIKCYLHAWLAPPVVSLDVARAHLAGLLDAAAAELTTTLRP